MGRMRRLDKKGEGPPVYTYEAVPGVPPVGVMIMRFPGQEPRPGGPPAGHAHSHDFLVLVYFERGGGSVQWGGREWPVKAGDAYVIAPGEVVGVGDYTGGLVGAEGWSVFFPAEVLGSQAPALLLVEVSRLAADVVGDLRLKDEPLLAEVFGFIEERYRDRISLKDVARAVGLTPGHLTTVVGRKTGRTIGEWIAERRMAEARRLLVETDLAVEEVGRRVGYVGAGYFARHFRRAHGVTPLGWRRAGRP
ncbi:MAG: AraC family transcriptional regulator [Actinobacteria bacterium]|nr:AraC family transcriptional regulator [Actinomycetota bacterium]